MVQLDTRLKNIKINAKFNSLLIIAFLLGIMLSGFILSNMLYQRAQHEITIQAELLMETMNSLRLYTQDHVNPLLKPQLTTTEVFIPEVIPTFSVREVSRYLSKNPEYENLFYKDATLNPTNPKDQADEFETKLVEKFKLQRQRKEITGFRDTPNGTLYYTARPFIVEKKRCLECHSTPDIAPPSLVATYGERGFGWELNDIVAAQMVYVPSEEVFKNARNSSLKMMSVVVSIFIAVILLINFLLKKVVIVRVKNIASTANAISMGDMNSNFQEDSKDEIGLLAISFERMKASLLIAMDLIDNKHR